MIIITNEMNVVVCFAPDTFINENGIEVNNLSYLDNGYPLVLSVNTAWVSSDVSVFTEIETQEEIIVNKYCYTEAGGFYLNPDYIEPDVSNTYGIPDELFNQIKADYREKIAQEVSGNGYNA